MDYTDKNGEKVNINSRTYNYSLSIIHFYSTIPSSNVGQVIAKQLLRSGTSIGANVTEAQACLSRKEFTKYYEIALRSANETKYWLSLLRDSQLLQNNEKIIVILREATEISNMIGAAIISLRKKK